MDTDSPWRVSVTITPSSSHEGYLSCLVVRTIQDGPGRLTEETPYDALTHGEAMDVIDSTLSRTSVPF